MSSLWAVKPVGMMAAEADSGQDRALKRVLGPFSLVTLGIGMIVGAGIFVLTGVGAAEYAGPAVILSFVLAGLAAVFAALCYAEFASMIPLSGSAYTYAYATLGEFPAWMIGWDLILEFGIGVTPVAVGWSGYVVSFLRDFGIVIPPALTHASGTVLVETASGTWEPLANAAGRLAHRGVDPASLPHATALVNLPAVLIVLLVTALLVIGIRESATINSMFVVLKVAVLAIFVVAGVAFVRRANWHPFIPANAGEFGHFGFTGVVRGAAVVFFAFIGFDAACAAAQEAKNPRRDVPIGILGSLLICTILYIAVAAVLTGIVPYMQLNVPDPIALGIDATGLRWLSPLIKVGAILGLGSVVIVGLLGQSRIFLTMARDGLLPKWAAIIHPRFRTPYVMTIVTGLFVAAVAGLMPLGALGELASIGTLLAFVVVCAGVLILRRTRPDLPRPFRTPFSPAVPLLGIFSCSYLMAGLPWNTWLRLLVWLSAGVCVYAAYGRRHSVLRRR
jgi:APA family basic amino acid/polyamine antiporter